MMTYQMFRLFYGFNVNPISGAMAEPALTRRSGANLDTLSRCYSNDAGPASAPPVGAGPPRLPPCQLVCVCMLRCCQDAPGASAAVAWSVASSASSWRLPPVPKEAL